MRYYYEKPEVFRVSCGALYQCDHPLYSTCTLYQDGALGLAVIQARFHPTLKVMQWGPIDPWLIDDIFTRAEFPEDFSKHAGKCTDGLYPTVTVRQIMHGVKMKPLKREFWESQ